MFFYQKGWHVSLSWAKKRRRTWFWHFPTSNFHETFTKSSLALNIRRKVLSDSITAIYCKEMAKNSNFEFEFWLFFSKNFHSGHIYVPNGRFWGFSSRPHIGNLVVNLFLLWGPSFMTWEGIILTKNGQTSQVCQRWKRPKGFKMAQISPNTFFCWSFGTILTSLEPFELFQTKIDFFTQNHFA